MEPIDNGNSWVGKPGKSSRRSKRVQFHRGDGTFSGFSLPKLNLRGLSPPSFYSRGFEPVELDQTENFFSERPGTMYKRSRTEKAPVATTSSVNYQIAQRKIGLAGREYYTTVSTPGTNAFLEKGTLLRPTDYGLFSWLGTIAKKFEEFKFISLRFVYEPQCATTQVGSVGMYFDGDPTHVRPATWNNFINTGANVHGAPWAKHVLDVPSHLFRSRNSYYTKNEFSDANGATALSSTQAVPTDPLEYYPGIFGFVVADTGVGTPGALGKIYLEYSIELKTQSIDGYTITNLTGDKVLSSEVADNSGVGYFVRGKAAYPAAAETFLIGGTGATLAPYDHAGDLYFDIPKLGGYYTARQDLELLVTIGCGSGGNITNLKLDTIRNGITTLDADMRTLSQEQTSGLVGYKYFYNVPAGFGATAIAHHALIKLEKGDQIRIKSTGPVGGLSSWNIVFSPTVFNVNS